MVQITTTNSPESVFTLTHYKGMENSKSTITFEGEFELILVDNFTFCAFSSISHIPNTFSLPPFRTCSK